MFVAAGLLAATPFASAASQAASQTAGEIVVARDVKIAMRLGVPLRASIYRPSGAAVRPAIFSLETDTTDARDRNARALAAAGYAVVIALPRAGDDKHIGRDGYDAVEWISEQSWSDRRVVMFGTGEGANAAWNTAREHPAHLASIVARTPARPLGWTSTEVDRVFIPALSIAGSIGSEQGTAVETHSLYVKAARRGGAPLAYLVIGTLDAPDLDLLERQWFDWSVGRGPISPLLRKRVNYLVVNTGVWLAADSLEAIGARPTSYPLHSNAGPRSAPGGFLGEAAREEESTDTVAGDKSYETLLAAPLELAGHPVVTLWLDRTPSAGLEVLLDEIFADGGTASLGKSVGVLAKVADSTAMRGNGPRRWEFASFPWIARQLAAGSKVRLTVRGASTVIYHDIERYSRVTLPVVKH